MSRRLLILLTALLFLGCGSAKFAPVSGTVTMDDKPLPKVYVNFQPVGTADNPNPGTGSYAVTDEQGRYTLKMVEDGKEGAVIGLHKVSISLQFAEDVRKFDPSTGSPDGTPALPRLGKVKQLPSQYNSESKLTFTVPSGGTDKADFKLESKP